MAWRKEWHEKGDVINWRTEAKYGDGWQRMLEETKAHLGLYCHWWWRRSPSSANCTIKPPTVRYSSPSSYSSQLSVLSLGQRIKERSSLAVRMTSHWHRLRQRGLQFPPAVFSRTLTFLRLSRWRMVCLRRLSSVMCRLISFGTIRCLLQNLYSSSIPQTLSILRNVHNYC